VREDTMIKSACLYPELPKGLDTAASLHTREPQWKNLIAYSKDEQKRRLRAGADPKEEDRKKHTACCIDSAVTFEICDVLETKLSDEERAYYRKNVSLLPAFLYMEKRGFNYNSPQATAMLHAVK